MTNKEMMNYAVAGVTLIVGAIALYQFVKDEAGAAAKAVGGAIDPTADTNLAYRGTNAVGAVLTGDPSFSLGSWLYDRFNPPYNANEGDINYEARKLQVRKEASVFDWLAGNG